MERIAKAEVRQVGEGGRGIVGEGKGDIKGSKEEGQCIGGERGRGR